MEDEAGEIRGIRGRRKEARYAQVFAMEGFLEFENSDLQILRDTQINQKNCYFRKL